MDIKDLSIGNLKTEVAASNAGNFSFAVGDMIGHYLVLKQLGRGGMGEVYHVRHTTLEIEYALKLLPPEFTSQAGALARFRSEAKVMARLDHPNIVKVDDFGDIDGRYWLRMELMSGLPDGSISLADLASANGGRFNQLVLAQFMQQALSGLQCAHEHGVIHRDLKPGNILLTGTPENITVKIADFGLVKLAGDEWLRSMVEKSMSANRSIGDLATEAVTLQGSSTNALLGTYAYMSPEQQRGEDIDTRSDLYSMGLIIFRLLTGENALGMKPPSRLVDGLLPDWDDLLYNALETKRDVRIASATEMLDAIAGILNKLKQQETELQALTVDNTGTSFDYVKNGDVMLVPELGMKMIYVEPGCFLMGSDDDGSSYNNDRYDIEKPVHEVTISRGYWIGKYEVTQSEYQSIVGSNPSDLKGDNKPVENVSWNDAVKFCEKLTEREHQAGRLPSGYEYRLPTEAEWEFAARGGIRSCGYKYSGSDDVNSVAWYISNSCNRMHEVGAKSGNELGIHDMSGNVCEWCYDWLGNYPGGSVTDPTGASSSSYRVIRGGSWGKSARRCRSTGRNGEGLLRRHRHLGFRLVMAASVK